MLLREHACSQCIGRVLRQYRHHGLGEDGAMIEFGRDLMHGGASKFATCLYSALMGIQARKRWQQRGVNIQHAPLVMRNKTRGQDAHEPCQNHQRRIESIYGLHQGLVKRLAAVEGFVVQALCVQTF